MEAKEAIKILHPDTTAKALAEYRRLGGLKEIKKATDEACLLACEALEKQVPKKPLTDRLREDGYCACPICNHLVDSVSNFCEHCGQALDFEEE